MLEAEDPGVPICEKGTPASPSKARRASVGPEHSSVSLPLRLRQQPRVHFVTLLPQSSVSPSVNGIQLRRQPG